MRRRTIGGGATALLLLATVAHAHRGVHDHLEALHKRHRDGRHAKKANETGVEETNFELVKRGGQCVFPTDAGLVAVTPGSLNAGWAMSPDQACEPGKYCPYACPPGEVSMQWDPSATTYSYPLSMNGGLYCDSNGQISKPFPDKPYCQKTGSNIGVINNAGGTVSFCQTVLPGNEAMLIPTSVDGSATLAVPGTDYWAGTAAHYYINPPGTSTSTACVWGTSSNPWGNWSPYVAGANVDASGSTFIKLGWNPIYLETTTPFRNTMPDWGVKIDCPNGGCNGLPCAIDPSTNKVNQMLGGASAGAGGGSFCVVTVAKGSTANFIVYGGSGSSSSSSGSSSANWKGGQFFQSSATTLSSTSSASTTTTTTTNIPTTHNSTSLDITSSTWSIPNATSSTGVSGPSGQPYFSLFNSTVQTTTGVSGTGATPTGPSTVKATSAKGSAARLSISISVLAPIALWPLI